MALTREQAVPGTKVKIPREDRTDVEWGILYLKEDLGNYPFPYLVLGKKYGEGVYYVARADGRPLGENYFDLRDLELYEEPIPENTFFPIQQTIDGLTALLKHKNTKYGNTGTTEGTGVFSQQSVLEKLFARADDKIARLRNRCAGELPNPNDVADLAGYCLLILTAMGKQDFTDQMD